MSAQEGRYEMAYAELANGRKRSHWMWYIFPQLSGLGSSPMARRYALSGLEEAKERRGNRLQRRERRRAPGLPGAGGQHEQTGQQHKTLHGLVNRCSSS